VYLEQIEIKSHGKFQWPHFLIDLHRFKSILLPVKQKEQD